MANANVQVQEIVWADKPACAVPRPDSQPGLPKLCGRKYKSNDKKVTTGGDKFFPLFSLYVQLLNLEPGTKAERKYVCNGCFNFFKRWRESELGGRYPEDLRDVQKLLRKTKPPTLEQWLKYRPYARGLQAM